MNQTEAKRILKSKKQGNQNEKFSSYSVEKVTSINRSIANTNRKNRERCRKRITRY